MNIQPIPTKYNGVEFRSRTEARWAVFFDELGVKWFYEYEGYQLPSGWYLPDFWLPELETFVEVKPATHTARTPCVPELVVSTGYDCIITLGSPSEAQSEARLYTRGLSDDKTRQHQTYGLPGFTTSDDKTCSYFTTFLFGSCGFCEKPARSCGDMYNRYSKCCGADLIIDDYRVISAELSAKTWRFW